MTIEIKIKGLIELDTFLQTLPAKLEANVLRSSMRAGVKVWRTHAVERVPVAPPNSENKKLYGGYAGALRDSIRIGTKLKGNRVVAYVRAGGKNKKSGADVYYAHMVEHGVKPHLISSKNGFLKIGNSFSKSVMHPGFVGRGFMRTTFDRYSQQVVEETAEKMRRTLEKKHGLTTPEPKQEGDE